MLVREIPQNILSHVMRRAQEEERQQIKMQARLRLEQRKREQELEMAVVLQRWWRNQLGHLFALRVQLGRTRATLLSAVPLSLRGVACSLSVCCLLAAACIHIRVCKTGSSKAGYSILVHAFTVSAVQ